MKRMIAPIIMTILLLVLTGMSAVIGGAPARSDHPILIPWRHTLNLALDESQTSGKPVLAILQDASSCDHCQAFQRTIDAHPLLAEAVADEFIALKLNRSQYQGSVSSAHNLLFLDAMGQPLISNTAATQSANRIAADMIRALRAMQRPVPNYLRAAAVELDTTKHKQAAFAMFCYWVGEYELGKIDGVVATEAGWLEGREVTLVQYHRDQLTLPDLARKAADVKCARKVYAPTEAERRDISRSTRLTVGVLDDRYRKAKASDQKKQIQHWELAGVSNITPMQRTKINALAPDNPRDALAWLSPRQQQGLPSALANYTNSR